MIAGTSLPPGGLSTAMMSSSSIGTAALALRSSRAVRPPLAPLTACEQRLAKRSMKGKHVEHPPLRAPLSSRLLDRGEPVEQLRRGQPVELGEGAWEGRRESLQLFARGAGHAARVRQPERDHRAVFLDQRGQRALVEAE
jgi:hypothetical protein